MSFQGVLISAECLVRWGCSQHVGCFSSVKTPLDSVLDFAFVKRIFVRGLCGNCMKFGPKMGENHHKLLYYMEKMGGNHQSHPCKTDCLRLEVIMKYCTAEEV